MQLYPAIDIKGGRCVRLTQGDFENEKIYSDAPAFMAKQWEEEGASFLHLVDLDGALSGHSVNEAAISEILRSVSIPVQLGGGIRSEEAVNNLLHLGIHRVIIGTKAVNDPAFMKTLIQKFGPEHVAAGVDARNGYVATEGWGKTSSMMALDLCMIMKEAGVRHIIYTDIAKDGMLSGPNVAETGRLTEKTGLDIIASGGVSSMNDLKQLSDAHIHGVIIGKALYEKKICLSEAVTLYESQEQE